LRLKEFALPAVKNKRDVASKKIYRKCPIRNFVFPLSLLFFFLSWHGIDSYYDYKMQQKMKMQQSVTGAVSEIAESLKNLKHAVAVFANDNLPLIQALSFNPENELQINQLNMYAKSHFPDYFAVTIADSNGALLIANFDLTVNEICQREIHDFIKGGFKNDIFVHPHIDAYHFDIMTPWDYEGQLNQKGVFFISIKPNLFSRVLKNSELLDHKLIILKRDVNGLIEITSQGTRIDTEDVNGSFFLSPDQISEIGFSMPIPGTRWDLAVIPDLAVLNNKRDSLIIQAIILFIGISLLSVFFIRLFRTEETLRYQSEHNLNQTKEQLEYTLEFSSVATWEYDLITKVFTWSSNADKLFNGAAPGTHSKFLENIQTEFHNDYKIFIRNCIKHTTPQFLEHKIKGNSTNGIWLEITGSHKKNQDTHAVKLIGLVQNINNRKIAEQNHMTFELKQKDALLREVHHRIKNNLQGIMNLLEQHKNNRQIDKTVLDHAITQLYSVSIIHGLHGNDVDKKIDLSNLVNMISIAAFKIIGLNFKSIDTLKQKFIINTVDNNTVSIALIINELIFNAIKHTPTPLVENIQINIITLADGAAIKISNPGESLPLNFNFNNGHGLGTGLSLVKSLMPKQGSSITIKNIRHNIITEFILKAPLIEVGYEEERQLKHKTA